MTKGSRRGRISQSQPVSDDDSEESEDKQPSGPSKSRIDNLRENGFERKSRGASSGNGNGRMSMEETKRQSLSAA